MAKQTVTSPKPSRSRAYLALVCIILGITAITLGLLLGYTSRVLFNSEAFADRVATSLGDPRVASLIADRITATVINQQRDLTAFAPLINGSVRAMVASEPFRGIVRRAAWRGHQLTMSGRSQKFLLQLSDVGVILHSALSTNPKLAEKIPSKISAVVGGLDEIPGGEMTFDLLQIGRRSRLGALGLLGIGVALSVIGIVLAPSRRITLLRFGITLAAIGLLLRLTVRFGGYALASLAGEPAVGQALVGIWHAFLANFMIWALVLAGIGLVLVAAVNSLFEQVKLEEINRRVWQWFFSPTANKWQWALRGVILLVLGGILSLAPSATLTIIAFLSGLVIAFIGLKDLFRLLLLALPHTESVKETAKPSVTEKTALPLGRVLLVGAVAIILIGVGAFYLLHTSETAEVSQTIDACNGYPELRNRRLDQVVFPASHNSMAGADIQNWMFPNQDKGITAQLNDGIRAFMIDAHYGVSAGDKIKTLIENEENAKQKYEAFLGKEGIAAAMRIRDRLIGDADAEQDVYMCHGFCELGAIALIPALRDIRDFLVMKPNEVIIIIIQDEGVTPQDIEKCFQESGLIDFVYHGKAAPPWPTLREMVESEQRVLVMTENNSAGVPWIHSSIEVMQETPYAFRDPSEFSNQPNRGGTAGSLLLMNHFITTAPAPLPSMAEKVNAYDFLLDRARKCQRERGKLPNLIAVDFYATGDLFAVTETLNGIDGARVAAMKAAQERVSATETAN
jgi:hypothetical protein